MNVTENEICHAVSDLLQQSSDMEVLGVTDTEYWAGETSEETN